MTASWRIADPAGRFVKVAVHLRQDHLFGKLPPLAHENPAVWAMPSTIRLAGMTG